jgi:hypothetical protein
MKQPHHPAFTRIGRLCAIMACCAAVAACAERAPAATDGSAVVDGDSPRELARVVEEMMPALERLSGLDRRETLRVRRQSRADARGYMQRRLAEEMPPDELDAVRRTYVALGMLPDTMDLAALLLDLYTEQVLGYYDPDSRTLFLVNDQSTTDLRAVIAHELVHALQDQHTDLDSLVASERGNDQQTAAHAAMEGHALLVMFAVLAEQATGQPVDPGALPNPADELGPGLDAQNAQYPVFRRAPAVIRETLLFPYIGGSGFVHALWSSLRPRERYPAPIDSLLPQSTEQIMRPRERFIAMRDNPVAVAVPATPGGWSVVRSNDLGQLETAIFLEVHLGAAARAAADGWAGDRYALFTRDGVDILDWRSVWDTEAAADAFAAAVTRVAARRTGRHISVERLSLEGRPAVRVVDAPAGAAIPPELSTLR